MRADTWHRQGRGGKDTRLGNNPFVMAVPRQKGHIVLDMAMSQYSYGKLQVTRLKGEQLPFPGGFDLDTSGSVTKNFARGPKCQLRVPFLGGMLHSWQATDWIL